MPVRSSPVSISGADARAVLSELDAVREAAEAGEIIGIAWVAITYDREYHVGSAGLMARNVEIANYGARRLSEALFWRSDRK